MGRVSSGSSSGASEERGREWLRRRSRSGAILLLLLRHGSIETAHRGVVAADRKRQGRGEEKWRWRLLQLCKRLRTTTSDRNLDLGRKGRKKETKKTRDKSTNQGARYVSSASFCSKQDDLMFAHANAPVFHEVVGAAR